MFLALIADIFNEVLTGLIGGAVVASAGLGVAYYKRRRVEALFPIAGDYISFYEDVEEGNVVKVRSESKISQKGKAVHIVTTLPNGRSWTLEGNILPGGHVSGVYSADAVYDDGVGSFYLKVQKDNLDGMWNGYDHQNRTTAAGRYWFRRMLKADIRTSEKKDVNDILHTATNAFGNGYISENVILNDETHFSIVAEVDGDFAGFCLGYRLPAGGLADFTKLELRTLPNDVRHAEEHGTLGTIKSIAVRRRYRGHGIGAKLISAAENRLVERGVTCILVPAWKMDGNVFIDSILQDQDYSVWTENPRFWKETCESREFECSGFDGGCRCGVIFYRKGRLAGI